MQIKLKQIILSPGDAVAILGDQWQPIGRVQAVVGNLVLVHWPSQNKWIKADKLKKLVQPLGDDHPSPWFADT